MTLPPFESDKDVLDVEDPMLQQIEAIPEAVIAALAADARRLFRFDMSKTARSRYVMNHCAHCDAKQGDHYVHGPDGPFWPQSSTEFESVVGTALVGPVQLSAKTSYSGAM